MTQKIKLITYNIRRGRGYFRVKDPVQKIQKMILEQKPDIVFLQEVWGDLENEPQLMRQVTGQNFPHKIYVKNFQNHTGHQGNAIFCRFEVQHFQNVDVSYLNLEKRGFLVVKAQVQDWPVWLVCIHFGLKTQERKFQFQRLNDYLQKQIPPKDSLIIAGDFNDYRGKLLASLIKENRLLDCFSAKKRLSSGTFPSFFPILSLDHILIRNCCFLNAWVFPFKKYFLFSDHLPVVAELELEKNSK